MEMGGASTKEKDLLEKEKRDKGDGCSSDGEDKDEVEEEDEEHEEAEEWERKARLAEECGRVLRNFHVLGRPFVAVVAGDDGAFEPKFVKAKVWAVGIAFSFTHSEQQEVQVERHGWLFTATLTPNSLQQHVAPIPAPSENPTPGVSLHFNASKFYSKESLLMTTVGLVYRVVEVCETLGFIEFIEETLRSEGARHFSSPHWYSIEQEVSDVMTHAQDSWLHRIIWYSWLKELSTTDTAYGQKEKIVLLQKRVLSPDVDAFLSSRVAKEPNQIACCLSYCRLVDYVFRFMDRHALYEAEWLTHDLAEWREKLLPHAHDVVDNAISRYYWPIDPKVPDESGTVQEKVAYSIRQLHECNAQGYFQGMKNALCVEKLVSFGADAVEALFDCLENNDAHSRSFVTSGMRWESPAPVPVRRLALFALLRIMNVSEYNQTTSVYYQANNNEQGRESARRLRLIWAELSMVVGIEDPLERLIASLEKSDTPVERKLEYIESTLRSEFPSHNDSFFANALSSSWNNKAAPSIETIRSTLVAHPSIARLSSPPHPTDGPAGELLGTMLQFRKDFREKNPVRWLDSRGQPMVTTQAVLAKLRAEDVILDLVTKLGDAAILPRLRQLIDKEKQELEQMSGTPRQLPTREEEVTWHNLFWCKLACTCYLLGSDDELTEFGSVMTDGATLQHEGLAHYLSIGTKSQLEMVMCLLVTFRRCPAADRALWTFAEPTHPVFACAVRWLLERGSYEIRGWVHHRSIIEYYRHLLKDTDERAEFKFEKYTETSGRGAGCLSIIFGNSSTHYQYPSALTMQAILKTGELKPSASGRLSLLAAYQLHTMIPESPACHPLASDAQDRVKQMDDWLNNHSSELHVAHLPAEDWWLSHRFGVCGFRSSESRALFVTILPLAHLAAYHVSHDWTQRNAQGIAHLPVEVRERYGIKTGRDDSDNMRSAKDVESPVNGGTEVKVEISLEKQEDDRMTMFVEECGRVLRRFHVLANPFLPIQTTEEALPFVPTFVEAQVWDVDNTGTRKGHRVDPNEKRVIRIGWLFPSTLTPGSLEPHIPRLPTSEKAPPASLRDKQSEDHLLMTAVGLVYRVDEINARVDFVDFVRNDLVVTEKIEKLHRAWRSLNGEDETSRERPEPSIEVEISRAMDSSEPTWLELIICHSWLNDLLTNDITASCDKETIATIVIPMLQTQLRSKLETFLPSCLVADAPSHIACYLSYYRLVDYVARFMDRHAVYEAEWLSLDLADLRSDLIPHATSVVDNAISRYYMPSDFKVPEETATTEEKVAYAIWQLKDCNLRREIQAMNNTPWIDNVVKFGADAVEPLLRCLEDNDKHSRSFVTMKLVHKRPKPVPVRKLALFALLRIMNVSERNPTTCFQANDVFEGCESARQLRLVWVELTRIARVPDPLEQLMASLQQSETLIERKLEYIESAILTLFPPSNQSFFANSFRLTWDITAAPPIESILSTLVAHPSIERLSSPPHPVNGPAGVLLDCLHQYRCEFQSLRNWQGLPVFSAEAVSAKLRAENMVLDLVVKLGDATILSRLRQVIGEEKHELERSRRSARLPAPLRRKDKEVTWHNLFWCKLACTCYLLGSDDELCEFGSVMTDGNSILHEGLDSPRAIASKTLLEMVMCLLVTFRRCPAADRALWTFADPTHPVFAFGQRLLLEKGLVDISGWYHHLSIVEYFRHLLKDTEERPQFRFEKQVVSSFAIEGTAGCFSIAFSNAKHYRYPSSLTTASIRKLSCFKPSANGSLSLLAGYQLHEMIPESPACHPLAIDAQDRVKQLDDWLNNHLAELHIASSPAEYWWLSHWFGVSQHTNHALFVKILPLAHLAAYHVANDPRLRSAQAIASLPVEVRELYGIKPALGEDEETLWCETEGSTGAQTVCGD